MTLITAVLEDITTLHTDVIVNAANSHLAGGGGVDGAIHRAGGPSILTECQAWIASNGHLPTGEAMATGAGDLFASLVIHTVGPVWGQQTVQESSRLLADCYRNSLVMAAESGAHSVAFPSISTGVYRFPKWLAAVTAVGAVRMWVESNAGALDLVTFSCFSRDNLEIYSDDLDV